VSASTGGAYTRAVSSSPPVHQPLVTTADDWRGHVLVLAAITVVTAAAWMVVVPPFEGTDELFFYNRARQLEAQPERRENVFYRLTGPVMAITSPHAGPVTPQYNPAFTFVGNARGEVNRFAHDRAVAPREHVRTLIAIRALVVLLTVPTVLTIYAIARLSVGSGGVALLAAALSLFIPQFSFISAVMHPEAVTRLFAAVVTLVVIARATGRLPRVAAWILLPLAVAVVPFADRQALFVAPFAALGLIASEPTWRGRVTAAAVLVVPAAIAAWIIIYHTELGTQIGAWTALVWHPLRPFIASDPGRGSVPPTGGYYLFEFLPKMFMGFWGWLGQPSILLPAWVYGVLACAMVLAAIGLLSRLRLPRPATDDERRRLLARRLLGAGIVLMWVPIVYGPAIMGLNLWYGRWLFPMIGPIAIALILGIAEFARIARADSRRTAAALGLAVAVLGVLWILAPGSALRAGITTNHYGDRDRLVATITDLLIALGIVAVAIEAAGRLRSPWPRALTRPGAGVALLGAANALLLVAFVRPLYAPLSAEEYATLVADSLAANARLRAADVYASAVKSYPESRTLRRLADDQPALLLGGTSGGARALLWDRLARGKGLNDRDALLMLAQQAADSAPDEPWTRAATLDAALADAEQRPDLAEAAALVRLAIAGDSSEAEAGRGAIEAAGGRRFTAPLRRGEVVVEGFTLHPSAGGTQLIVYFRPRVNADNRRLWVHIQRPGTNEYAEVPPALAAATWTPHHLTWAAFNLPPGRFNTAIGMWEGASIGDGLSIGIIP
jgi:hypothetical protein